MNFIEKCVSGTCSVNEIDDYIEYWHNNDTGNTLSEFLGMSDDEFNLYTKYGNDCLNSIIEKRKTAHTN